MRLEAEREIEVMIGADRVLRLNVDGICAFRVAVASGCIVRIRNDAEGLAVYDARGVAVIWTPYMPTSEEQP